MTGLSDAREVATLDSIFSGTLYLRLLQWNGAVGGGAGLTVNDDGTLPANVAEPTTGGYAPLSVSAASWAAAVAGAPTTKTVPNAAHSPLQFVPSGAAWNLCGYAWTTDTNAITSSNYVSGGVFVDSLNVPMIYHVADGEPLKFTDTYPIVERLGDPPVGVNPI